MSLNLKRYTQAFIFSLIIFNALSFYLYLRRGYYDLYIANKAFAGTAFILVGVIFLLGPLGRLYQKFDRFLILRKEFGIIAFFFGLIHPVVSLFMLPTHFPLENYLNNKLTFTAGLLSTGVLFYLFILSFERFTAGLDKKKWWMVQNWGLRILGVFLLLHVLPMKIAGYVKWYQQGGGPELLRPYLPGAGLLVVSFGVFVLLVRLSEFAGEKAARLLIPFFALAFVVFLVFTFWWGIR